MQDKHTSSSSPLPSVTSSSLISSPHFRNAISGSLSGALAKTLVAPIERVKLLLQLQTSTPLLPSTRSNKKRYANAFDAATRVYKEQGLASFWRGNLPNLYRHTGSTALTFVLKDNFRDIFISPTSTSKRKKFLASLASGGAAGFLSTCLFYPLEFIRTRLALDTGESKSTRLYPNGTRSVLSSTLKSDGISGFYKGFPIALVGVVLFRAIHLGGYDFAKSELLGPCDIVYPSPKQSTFDLLPTRPLAPINTVKQPLWKRFIIAEVISLVAGTLIYPIDSIRRRLMMQSGLPADKVLYNTSLECTRHVYKHEGFKGFFRGVGPNMIRSVGGAVLLVSYDEFKEVLG